MANDKLYDIAGTSTRPDGVVTLRVATGEVKVREGVLRRGKHTDIKLEKLPQPMTRADAAAFLAAKGVIAVIPAKGGGKVVELTPEQKAAAEKEAKRIAANEAKRLKRAGQSAAKKAAEDKNFLTEALGTGETVPVPEVEADGDASPAGDLVAEMAELAAGAPEPEAVAS